MSSNKIGFLSASALYVAIFLAIWQFDCKIRTIGEMGESRFFSIRLENIESVKKQRIQKNISHFNQNAKSRKNSPTISKNTPPQTPPARGGAYFDSPSLAEGDKGGGYESKSKSVADSPTDSSESNAIAQSALGENDPYFLSITRIINRFHAKAPVQNIRHTFEVGVAFSVNTMGEIEHLRIIESSGNEKLDNIAIRTIRNASRNFPTPKKNYHLKTALVYKR